MMKDPVFLLPVLCMSLLVDGQAPELQKTSLLITGIRTGDTEVFIVDPVTGDAFNLTKAPTSEERYPVWMPDRQRVVFTLNREDGNTFNLYIINRDGSGMKKLTNETGGSVYYFPSVQSDGTKIWFSFARGEKSMIGYVSPDGKSHYEIAEGPDGNISPDGKKIALTIKQGRGFHFSTHTSYCHKGKRST